MILLRSSIRCILDNTTAAFREDMKLAESAKVFIHPSSEISLALNKNSLVPEIVSEIPAPCGPLNDKNRPLTSKLSFHHQKDAQNRQSK